jgi:hypothetical protein
MHQPSEFCEPLDSFTAAFFGRSEGKLLKVDIEEVSFSGTKYHELKSDDVSETYSAPHWVDNPPPSTRQWLSYSKAHLPESAPSLRSMIPASGKVKPPSFLLTAKTQSGGRIRNDDDEDDLPM